MLDTCWWQKSCLIHIILDKLNNRARVLYAVCFVVRDSFLCVCTLSYLKGMLSFGLLETHFYDQAEKAAMEVSVPASILVHYMLLSLSRLVGTGCLMVPVGLRK